jgi:hypothetical protein
LRGEKTGGSKKLGGQKNRGGKKTPFDFLTPFPYPPLGGLISTPLKIRSKKHVFPYERQPLGFWMIHVFWTLRGAKKWVPGETGFLVFFPFFSALFFPVSGPLFLTPRFWTPRFSWSTLFMTPRFWTPPFLVPQIMRVSHSA